MSAPQVDPTEVCEVCDGFLFAGDEPGYVQVPGSGRYLPDNGVAVCSRQCGEEASANGAMDELTSLAEDMGLYGKD